MSDDERDDDPDREAILARRKKLIAVALAGLTSAAGCGDDGGIGPQPCLEMAPVPEQTAGPDQTTLTPIDPKDERESEAVVAEEEGDDEANEGEEAGEGEDAEDPEAYPQVCLRVRPPPRPPPVAPPQPCLDVAVPPDDDPVVPRPCLTPRIDRGGEEG